MGFDRAQLKQKVKLSMKATFPGPMVVTLLFTVVVSVGTWLINTVLGTLLTGDSVGSFSNLYLNLLQQGYEVEEAMEEAMLMLLSRGPGALFAAVVGGAVLSILVALWQGAMNVGYEGWCLSMVRRENPLLSRIFCALPQIGPVLVTRFLTGLFELLWSMLLSVGYAVIIVVAALIDIPVITGLLILAGIAALFLGIIWVTMRYALVDYALLDKGLSGLDAIRESKRLMQGNIGKGFVLQLSFFGWYLLEGLLACLGGTGAVVGSLAVFTSMPAGAGVAGLLLMVAAAIGAAVLGLWLQPYTTGAMAGFYDWAGGTADGRRAGPDFGAGADGWSDPGSYTWTSGPTTGTGSGSGGQNGGDVPPRPKQPPRDDPWN